MVTSGLLGFVIRGECYTTFNLCDSYLEGLGKNIVKFILGLPPKEYATMARLVADITWVDSESTETPSRELQERYQKLGFTQDLNRLDDSSWSYLLSNLQGGIALAAIQSGELKHMKESRIYGWPWQWAYFVDFENCRLETWTHGYRVNDLTFEELVECGVEGYIACVELDIERLEAQERNGVPLKHIYHIGEFFPI